tara:strand:+ start:1912 stop:2283 length:372 start_codon:yes stop_codon:yes gene_type:complete
VVTTPIERAPLVLTPPDILHLDPVEWYVITPENMTEIFAKLDKRGVDLVLFGLTDEGYETQSINMANIRKYIKQQAAMIVAYQNYQKSQNQMITAAEKHMAAEKSKIEESNANSLLKFKWPWS